MCEHTNRYSVPQNDCGISSKQKADRSASPQKVSILGAGNWGTTLAIMLSDKADISLWTFEKIETRENKKYLPGYEIPSKVQITMDIEESITGAELIVFAIPSQVFRSVAKLVGTHKLPLQPILLSVTKGIEKNTYPPNNWRAGKRMSEILLEEIKTSDDRICVLAGPTIAREVIRGIPTSCVCAGKDKTALTRVQDLFNSSRFRVYTSSDVIGAELGGALKNVIALAAGICDGLGLGVNSKGALLTRGLREITRLGVCLGAEAETFAGLSGMGDLITTAFSKDSRNHWVGEQLGKGQGLKDILSNMNEVAEGVYTTEVAYELSRKCGISMPITQEIYKILFENESPLTGIETLMSREPKPEKL